MIFLPSVDVADNYCGSSQEQCDVSSFKVLLEFYNWYLQIHGPLCPSQGELQIVQCNVISGISVTMGKLFCLSYSEINSCIFHLIICHL